MKTTRKSYIKLVLISVFTFAVMFSVVNVKMVAYGATINSDDVKIYIMEDWAKAYIDYEDGKRDSFQLKVTGASKVTYSVFSGESVVVSSTGLITPNYETWYWNGNIGSTWPTGAEGEVETKEPIYGKSIIKVTADGKNYYVDVEVLEYEDYYANKVMDEYIKDRVTSATTEYEKLEIACQFVASYNYSPYYSSVNGMIISGGGDCWSSTYTLIALLEKMDIEAWARYAANDSGAGSGHRNTMAIADGKYYVLEAGYAEEAPRYYDIVERKSLFSVAYSYDYDGVVVYQYDGKTGQIKELVIPSQIEGEDVVEIDSQFLQGDSYIEKVTIPSTVRRSGKSAFNSCSKLKSLNIPASVQVIEDFAFTNCQNLTSFTCDSNNGYFSISNGVLYNKNKTKVISVPAAKEVTLASTVTEIGGYSFYYNKNITSIVIPASVTTISEGAFGDCHNLKNVTIKGSKLKKIDAFAFYWCNLSEISLPSSVDYIGNYAFEQIGDITLKGKVGSVVENYAKENELKFRSSDPVALSECTVSLNMATFGYTGKAIKPVITVKYKGENLTAWTDYGISYTNNVNVGTANITLTGRGDFKGTVKKTFSIKYNLAKMSSSMYSSQFGYTGNAIKPVVTVKNGTTTLKAWTDYKIEYANNIKTGKATITLTGRGNYTGKLVKTFYIVPKKMTINSLTSPLKKWIKLFWTSDANADGYQIVYATNKTFTQGKGVIDLTSKNYKSKGINLQSGKRYYVQIRAYKIVDGVKKYGGFSNIKSIVCK